MSEEVLNQPSEESATVDQISFQDLQNVVQIIDVASERGAFRANEMSQIGTVYDKLRGFVDYVVAQQEEKAAQEAEDKGEA